ncbi:hypothetical protein E2320_003317 [Naja naja]|nr:hypothetical protein E2320_003317 [Naja naja]
MLLAARSLARGRALEREREARAEQARPCGLSRHCFPI